MLFNRTNSAELVGKTAVFDSDKLAVFASYLIRFRIDCEKADPRFVATYINSEKGRKFIERHMTRAIGQVNISASTMHEMLIPTPDLSIQEKIMDEFENRRVIVDELREKLNDEYNAIASLPTSLLRQAFTGNL